MRAVIDTCIIIDSLQKRQPFDENANTILFAAAENRFDGFLTAKSITDIYYLVHHFTHSGDLARDAVKKLFEIYDVADTSAVDCRRAADADISDFEDAVMIETAKRIGADCIVTRNVNDYKKSDVKVYTPEQFILLL